MQTQARIAGAFVALTASVLLVVGWPGPAPAGATPSESEPVDAAPAWQVPQGLWGSAEHGLALVPPPGWTETRRSNRDYLDRVADSAADGNFCVITIPNMLGLSFEQVVLQNREAFESMPGLELIRAKPGLIDGHDVLRSEYLATHLDTGAEYHCLGIALLRGGQQVVLTLTIASDQWDEQRELVEAAIDSIVLAPRS